MTTVGRLLGRARALFAASAGGGRPGLAPPAMEALESAMAGLSPQCLGLSSSAQDRVDLGGAVVSMEVYSDPSVSLVRALRVVPARTGLTRPQEVFILPRGAALPLHDHPDMTVLSKM